MLRTDVAHTTCMLCRQNQRHQAACVKFDTLSICIATDVHASVIIVGPLCQAFALPGRLACPQLSADL